MSWLARLKSQKSSDVLPTKPLNPPQGDELQGFVGSVGYPHTPFPKLEELKVDIALVRPRIHKPPYTHPTKPTKPQKGGDKKGFVGFVGTSARDIQEFWSVDLAPVSLPPTDPQKLRELAQAYYAHHWGCKNCIAGGQGRGQRCAVGDPLWNKYDELFEPEQSQVVAQATEMTTQK